MSYIMFPSWEEAAQLVLGRQTLNLLSPFLDLMKSIQLILEAMCHFLKYNQLLSIREKWIL